MSRFVLLLAALALAALAPLPARAADESAACLECHGDPKMTADLEGGGSLSLFVDGGAFPRSVHGEQGLSCTDCHAGMTPDHATGTLPVKTRHELTRKASEICAGCHAEQAKAFAESVHGRAGASSDDVPACADCHAVHAAADHAAGALSLRTPLLCGRCHADERRMSRYGISTQVVKTYLADFHGMVTTFQRGTARAKGVRLAAACTDCHGVHDIQKTDDPRSRVMAANLQRTCQQCHPGAPAMFPQAWLSHWEPSPTKAPAVWTVRQFYRVMIPFMMSGLLLQIGLHVFSFRKRRRR